MKRKPRVPTKPARVQKFVVNALRRHELARKADAANPYRFMLCPRTFRRSRRETILDARQPRANRWRRKLEAVSRQ